MSESESSQKQSTAGFDGAVDRSDGSLDNDALTREQRLRNAEHSRRSYYKAKSKFDDLHNSAYNLRAENLQLKAESQRLQGLVDTANKLVAELDRISAALP